MVEVTTNSFFSSFHLHFYVSQAQVGKKNERNGDARPHFLTLIDLVFVYFGM